METVPAGVQLTFEVTYDSDTLPVAMSVYDTSGSIPVLVDGPTAMVAVVGSTYIGTFIPSDNTNYLVFKAVYTNGSYTTLDPNYAAGSESIYAATQGGGGGSVVSGSTIVGFVVLPLPVVGYY